jgi:hypothetical protein
VPSPARARDWIDEFLLWIQVLSSGSLSSSWLKAAAASYWKKIALVTGATRGIGLETGRQLAKAGVRVLLAGRSLAAASKAASWWPDPLSHWKDRA